MLVPAAATEADIDASAIDAAGDARQTAVGEAPNMRRQFDLVSLSDFVKSTSLSPHI